MDTFSKSIKMLKRLIIASITLFFPLTAIAQTNGSNSSGTNTTSFTGAPGSIWSGDRSPIVVPEPSTKVISLPVQPKELIIVPTQTKVITAPPVKPQTKPQTKPRPKYVKSKHPRARG